jgi:hypothetical protein
MFSQGRRGTVKNWSDWLWRSICAQVEDSKTVSDFYEIIELTIVDRQQKVLDWLFPGRIDLQHTALSAKRAENTGEWFLTSPEFIDWVDEKDCNLLYCPGIRTQS